MVLDNAHNWYQLSDVSRLIGQLLSLIVCRSDVMWLFNLSGTTKSQDQIQETFGLVSREPKGVHTTEILRCPVTRLECRCHALVKTS